MQPQDQNYQNDDQNAQQPAVDEPTLNAEPLQPAPTSDDSQAQPPMTPFVDGDSQSVDESTGQLSPEPSQPAYSEPSNMTEPLSEPVIQPDNNGGDNTDMSYQSLGSPSEDTNATQPVVDEPKPFNPSEFETIDNAQDNPVSSQEATVDQTISSEGLEPVAEQPAESPSSDSTVEDMAVQPETQPVEDNPPATQSAQAERVSLTDHSSFTPQEPQAIANTTVASAEEKENIYTEICSEIIKEQEQIIGTLAVEQANYVEGLSVDPVSYHCTVTGDGSKVIDDLIEQYRDFFGHAAVEVCKEAASRFLARLPAEELPTSLR